MKIFTAIIVLLISLCALTIAQQNDTRIGNGQPDFAVYDFNQFNSTFTSIANTTGEVVLATGTLDDQTYPNRNIGFTFTFDSTAYTTFGVSANGYIIMGSGAVPTNYTVLNFTTNDVIAAFGADLQSYTSTGRLSYVVTGAPPIRVLTIQWTDFGFWTGTGPDSSHMNCQMKLYETSNIIQFVYGTNSSNSTVHNVQAGLRGVSTTDVSSRTTTSDWSATAPGISTSTCRYTPGVTPPPGLSFQWSPPASVAQLCENFSSSNFPPTGWSVTSAGTSYLSRSPVSALCLGSGSLKFDFFSWASGTQSFSSPIFPPVVSGSGCDSLMFMHAKAGQTGSTDIMQIQTSTNGGLSWNELVLISTQLNTAPPQGTAFTPNCTQWGRKSYRVPGGTNRIRFNATTAHDNNLYLDSICIACSPLGIGNTENVIPKEYSLSQNYPNPFNPSTKIKFAIPGTSSAQTFISVFDILGKEVAVLVNESLKPGNYEVELNASDYPSGVYFYTITSANYSNTKKMVLIK